MNKKELIKNITSDIQDIYSATNRFENTEKIHPLDIDLALSKVRNLYELLLKLNSTNPYTSENQREEISTKVQHTDTPSENKKVSTDEKPVEKEDQPVQKESIEEEPIKEEPVKEPEFIIESKSIKKEDSVQVLDVAELIATAADL